MGLIVTDFDGGSLAFTTRIYAVMMGRVLNDAEIPAAEQAFALLIQRIAAIATEGRLRLTVEVAADLMWASANAASLLYVTAWLRKAVPPTSEILEQIREGAIRVHPTS